MPTTLEQLYTPVAVPSALGETTQPTGSSQTWGTQEQSELVTALMGTETTDVTPIYLKQKQANAMNKMKMCRFYGHHI